jgi:hypothetical protein
MKNKYILLIIILLSIAYWITLAFGIPVFQSLRFWFWQYEFKPPVDWWIIPLIAAVLYFSVSIVLKHHHNQRHNIIILIFTGYFLQFGFSFIEGKGFDSLKDRMIVDGHAEFASVATKIDDIGNVACHYEELADSNKIGVFPKSKPPGALIIYTILEKTANIFSANDTPQDKYERFISFAVFIFPLIAYLVLLPLYGIGREILPEKYANLPGLLYIFLPNINLVTMHLDQVLYPLLVAVTIWLMLSGIKNTSFQKIALAGILLYVSLYISFSLTIMFPLLLILIAIFSFYYNNREQKSLYLITYYVVFLLGFFATALIMKLVTDYDIILRFSKAIKFHADWKVWEPSVKWVTFYAGLNIIEISVWSGIAFAYIFYMGIYRAGMNMFRKNIDLISVISVVFSALVLLQAFVGYTKGETARLWVFLLPIAVLVAANEINLRFKNRPEFSIKLILLMQLITTLMIKVFQDF